MTDTIDDDLPARPQAQANPSGLDLVVGIGASAGGIRALQEFFAHVPPGSGFVYVVILHLSPGHDSRLAEVLQSVSTIPITQVIERTRIERDHAYVIPPNRSLTIEGDELILSEVTRNE